MSIYHRSHQKRGRGIYDNTKLLFHTLLHPTKFGEYHVTGIDKGLEGVQYNWAGPKTDIEMRDKIPMLGIPKSDTDAAAQIHDHDYQRIRHEVERGVISRDEGKREIWNADNKFIQHASQSKDDPKMGQITSSLVGAKMQAEKMGVLPTSFFSGVGKKKNPFKRLVKKSNIVKVVKTTPIYEHTKIDKVDKVITGGKKKIAKHRGGFAFMLPILSTLASTILPEIGKWAYSKITGNGLKKQIQRRRKLYIK